MPFVVKYVQDMPKNCGTCPCSVHITPKEVYCNARQKHLEVKDTIPAECGIMECDEILEEMINDTLVHSCENCKYGMLIPDDVRCTNWNICIENSLWEAKE